MGPEVSDGWTKLLELELKDPLPKLVENELKDCPTKIDGQRAEGLSCKIIGEHVAAGEKVVKERVEGFTYACRNCSCRKTNSRELVWVGRSRMADGPDGADGYDGADGIDGVDGMVGTRGHRREVPLVLGGDEWRRMVASTGGWGADTEGADVEVLLCPQW